MAKRADCLWILVMLRSASAERWDKKIAYRSLLLMKRDYHNLDSVSALSKTNQIDLDKKNIKASSYKDASRDLYDSTNKRYMLWRDILILGHAAVRYLLKRHGGAEMDLVLLCGLYSEDYLCAILLLRGTLFVAGVQHEGRMALSLLPHVFPAG